MKRRFNRWGISYAKGDHVTAHTSRGDAIRGVITRIFQENGLTRIEIDSGITVAPDDIRNIRMRGNPMRRTNKLRGHGFHPLQKGFLIRGVQVFAEKDSYGNLGGQTVRAVSGSPVTIHKVSESGRGANRQLRLFVSVDYAGKEWVAWIDPDNFSHLKINPKRLRASFRRGRVRYQGGDLKAWAKSARQFEPGDKRKIKRALRKKGVRVNPTARRASYVVSAQERLKGDKFDSWFEQGSFKSKVAALDYARSIARGNANFRVKVVRK